MSDNQKKGLTFKISGNKTFLGIAIIIFANLMFAVQDAITKNLTESVPVPLILLIRYIIFCLFIIYLASRNNGVLQSLKSKRPLTQILRGAIICAEIALFAYTLKFIGLAEMHAIFSCFPLIATAMAPIILKEKVGWRRWCAVIVGFTGTLLIIQPGEGVFDSASLLGLLAAAMFALYSILTRKVSEQDSFITTMLYFGFVGLVLTAIVAPFYWQPLTNEQVFQVLMISISSVISHSLLMRALQLAPAVVLQPFNYFVLVWATIFGFLFFQEVLELTTVVGVLIVVSSGIFIARREYVLKKTTTKITV